MNGIAEGNRAHDLTTSSYPHLDLHVGQRVHVNHRESWHAATVTAVMTHSVQVSFHAIGFPACATTAAPTTVNPWLIRPAEGMTLRPVTQLATGDQIMFHTTIHTLAAPPWKGRDGWMILALSNQARCVLPARAVLRVVDDTPQVTVHGVPIGPPYALS